MDAQGMSRDASDMDWPTLSRRRMIVTGAALGVATALTPAALAADATATEVVDLAVPGRTMKMSVWRPAGLRGVVLFSTGFGSWPERYARLIELLTAQGFAVLAPLHVDSMHNPDRAKFGEREIFLERLADLRAASAYAATAFPGKPVVAAGHSFGSLMSLCLGGALAYLMPLRNPTVKAVLAFSTAGKVAGLIRPTAYSSMAVPLMLVTGSRDVVEGFVTDPADHLFPAETDPAGSFALVVDGGDHSLVEGPLFAHAAPAARLFLLGYGLDEARSRAALARWRPTPPDRFIVRRPAA